MQMPKQILGDAAILTGVGLVVTGLLMDQNIPLLSIGLVFLAAGSIIDRHHPRKVN